MTGDFEFDRHRCQRQDDGPALAVDRTYDSGLARSETSSGASPGLFGYGWSSTLGESLSAFTPKPNTIYMAEDGFQTSPPDLITTPQGMTIDSSGNVYVADTANATIEELAATNHTQWGIPMGRRE